MKKILALIMCACMLLCFAACGQGAEETTAQTDPEIVETTLPIANTNPIYTVKVVDDAGNPIAGAMVQICSENCYPGVTNEEGVASFSVVEDTYKVSFISIPAGYALTGDAPEIYYEEGARDITITLTAAE